MLLFGILFSIGFFIIRHFDIIPMHVLLTETNGIGFLDSAISLIFGIISAFVIQTQWDNWNSLLLSVHSEIKSIRQLLLSSESLSKESSEVITKAIQKYVERVIIFWHHNEKEKAHKEVVYAIKGIHENICKLRKERNITATDSKILYTILNYHNDVLHYSARRLPTIVKILIQFSVFLVIVLPLFIGVRTLWLDYIITLSIALLAFLIYLVISDLNNPLAPGNWHISSEEYQELLEEISN